MDNQRYGSEQTNDLAYPVGKRFVAASEGERGQKLAESKIKKMTGDDPIVCRHLYKDFFEFNPQFKLWLATNELPSITGMDNAMWRRVMVIRFPVEFPEKQQDNNLVRRLTEELPGILNWAIGGYYEWKNRGFNPPEQVIRSTGQYRTENDSTGQWIDSECIVATSLRATMKDLYQSYRAWCESGGLLALSSSSLGKDLERRGLPTVRARAGNGRRGIGLRREPNGQSNPLLGQYAKSTSIQEPVEQAQRH